MKAIIQKCTCKHDSQDKLHGAGNRVKNQLARKGQQPLEYRCTVCGTVNKG